MKNEDALLFLSYLNFDYKIKDEFLEKNISRLK